MINKDVTQKTIIVILLIVLYVPLKIVIDSARLFEVGRDNDPGDTSDFNKTGSYKIDSNTILNFIDQNQSPVFLPETTVFPDQNSNNSLEWTQSEFMRVANAFFGFVWKESLDKDWSIHKMSFKTNCKENPLGFEYATFVFYQLIFEQGELKYNARAMDISPVDGNVSWGGDSIFIRPILGSNEVDLEKLHITADDALNIAEENGGKATRQSIQNKCDIYLVFNGNWQVVYDGYNGLPILKVNINPYTGKIITSR